MTTPPTDRAATPIADTHAAPRPPMAAPLIRRMVVPVAIAITVLLSGCQGDATATDPGASTTSAPVTSAPATPTPASSGTPTPGRAATPKPTTTSAPTADKSAPSADVTIDVSIADGKVRPNAENVDVSEGQRVRVTITSDVNESIHVHGYDKTAEATPDKPGAVTFTADVKGVFEIETHESAKLVAKLIVS